MAKTVKVERNGEFLGFAVNCPACHDIILFDKRWTFNGNYEEPTFSPSMLLTSPGLKDRVCHSFVTDGKIQFLNDCTHSLKGQTVELPAILYDDYN